MACEYSDPRKARFAYRLINFDKDWVDGSNLGFARYANLPFGKYRFEVKAANSDGIWSNNPKSIDIIILTPWWGGWWAKAFYLFVFVGLGYAIYYWRSQKERKKLIQKEKDLTRKRKSTKD